MAANVGNQLVAAGSLDEGTFQILYFAAASTFTRKTSETLPAPLCSAKLFDVLEARYKGIKAKILSSSLVTVNLEYIDVCPLDGGLQDGDDTARVMIQPGDEVAIIPPVSSG